MSIASVAGCASTVLGYANNSAGHALGAKMCESVRRFVHSPLGAESLRRAWFLSFDAWGEDVIAMSAPMASRPTDEHARSFYEQRVGQLTHYACPPEFAEALASCLNERHGFTRLSRERTSARFRASLVSTSKCNSYARVVRRLEGKVDATLDQVALPLLAVGGQHRIEAHLAGLQFAPHRHDTYAVALTLAGVQTSDYRGTSRHSLPGGVVVIHPDERHNGRPGTADRFSYHSIHVEPAHIQRMLGDSGLPFLAGVPRPIRV